MSDRRVGFTPDVGYMAEGYTAFKNMAGPPKFWRKRRDEFRKSAAACFPS